MNGAYTIIKNVLLGCLCITILSVPVLFWFVFNTSDRFDAACAASNGIAVHSIRRNICIKPEAIISLPPENIIDIPDMFEVPNDTNLPPKKAEQ